MPRNFGSGYPHTLDSMENLASVYIAFYRWEDAVALYTAVVTTRKKNLGEDHEDTLKSASDLNHVTQMHQGS